MPKNNPTNFDPTDTPEVGQSTGENAVEQSAAGQDVLGDTAAGQSVVGESAAVGPEEAQLKLSDQLEQLRAELEEAKDRALRSQAELENYRKRAARQLEEERRYAHLGLIRDLLPVADNVERAIQAGEKTSDAAGLLQGFKMVAQQLEAVLKQYHCVKIEALNMAFDPSRHEAISHQPSDQHPANTVLYVARNGFQLHDRVVRPSQVIVSSAAADKEPTEDTPSPEAQ